MEWRGLWLCEPLLDGVHGDGPNEDGWRHVVEADACRHGRLVVLPDPSSRLRRNPAVEQMRIPSKGDMRVQV